MSWGRAGAKLSWPNQLLQGPPVIAGGSSLAVPISHYGYVDERNPTTSYGSTGTNPVARKVVFPSGGGTNYEQEGFIVFRRPMTGRFISCVFSNPVELSHNGVTVDMDMYSNGTGTGNSNWRAFFRFYGVTSWAGHGTLPADPNPINWNNRGDILLTDSAFCGSIRAVPNGSDTSSTLIQDHPVQSHNTVTLQGTANTILGVWFKLHAVVAPGFSSPTSGDYYSAMVSINPTGTPSVLSAN